MQLRKSILADLCMQRWEVSTEVPGAFLHDVDCAEGQRAFIQNDKEQFLLCDKEPSFKILRNNFILVTYFPT